MSFFQSDVNITSTLQSEFLDSFLAQVSETNTSAIVYLTVYPMEGFDKVSDSALSDLSSRLKKAVDSGRKVFIRYAPEMSGNWFRYGQQPVSFKDSWKRVIGYLRQEVNSKDIAFLWAPNSGNGYPFKGTSVPLEPGSESLDTNGNGNLDNADDPYTPYYPGDEWVDWVGFSIYHYGKEYPWETNDIPDPGKFEAILTRQGNFYRMFSGDGVGGQPTSLTKGSKPFFVSETGSTFHLYVHNGTAPPEQGAGRVAIKQAWWRQYLNASFLAAYPKVKAIGTFEFIKYEETSFRDFTNMGDARTGINSPFGNDGGSQGGPIKDALMADLESPEIKPLIIWANNVLKAITNDISKLPTAPRNSHGAVFRTSTALLLVASFILFAF